MKTLRTALVLSAALAVGSAWAQSTSEPAANFKILRPLVGADGGAAQTTQAVAHVLGRVEAGARVDVAGQPAAVFATGIFVRDNLPLQMGSNPITVTARLPGGAVLNTQLTIERVAPPAPPQWPEQALFINGASLLPQQLHRLAPGDTVEVRVQATPGQWVQARLPGPAGAGQQPWVTLPETTQAGIYRARLGFAGLGDVAPQPVQIRLQARSDAPAAVTGPNPGPNQGPHQGQRFGVRQNVRNSARAPRAIVALTPGSVGQWAALPERLWTVGADGAELLHGLHDVRLGGPYLAELPPGTLLQARALQGTEQGDHLQVQLSPDTQAWVPVRAVAPAPAGTARPQVHVTSLSLQGSAAGDVLQIPLPAAVPYAVNLVSALDGRQALEVLLYGAHHATTWITHRQSARLVSEVSAEQAAADVVRLRLALRDGALWGWRAERSASTLQIHVLPKPDVNSSAPLQGLRIALEPGHGGPTNLGAVGATGVPEKDINRWTVEALQAELQAAGAQVLLVRSGDSNPSHRERVRAALEGGAQLFLSVHSNAADTSRGALRVGGTSSYYKHANGRALAAAVHTRMLQLPGAAAPTAPTGPPALADFGLVGNFNYTPLRLVTQMPAALLELAFLTHPGDEARLLDPDFRGQIAKAVRQGLEDFVRDGVAATPKP